MKKRIVLFLVLFLFTTLGVGHAKEVFDSSTGKATCVASMRESKLLEKNHGMVVIEFYHNIFNGCTGTITMEWKIGSLMRDPVVYSRAKWELSSVNVKHPMTGKDVTIAIKDIPPEVRKGIRIWNMKIFSSFERGSVGYRFDQGAMSSAGGDWSFTTPGSPEDWSHFLVTDNSKYFAEKSEYPSDYKLPVCSTPQESKDFSFAKSYGWKFVSYKFAKEWGKEGFDFSRHELVDIGFDLNSVKAWLWQQESAEAKKLQKQVKAEQKKALKQLEQEKAAFAKKEKTKKVEEKAEDFFETFEEDTDYATSKMNDFTEQKNKINALYAEKLHRVSRSAYIEKLEADSERKKELAAQNSPLFELRTICQKNSKWYFKNQFETEYGKEPYWGSTICLRRGKSTGKYNPCMQCWYGNADNKSDCRVLQSEWNTKHDAAKAEFDVNIDTYLDKCVAEKVESLKKAVAE